MGRDPPQLGNPTLAANFEAHTLPAQHQILERELKKKMKIENVVTEYKADIFFH